MTDDEPTSDHPRAISLNIPAAILLGALLQAAGAIWWASTAESRLGQINAQLIEHRTRLDAFEASRSQTGERLARVEQMTSDILESVRRFDSKLDRVQAEHH